MPRLNLSHFEYCVLFALFTSIVMGIVSERSDRKRMRCALRCFAYFMFAIFAVGWLMYLGHG